MPGPCAMLVTLALTASAPPADDAQAWRWARDVVQYEAWAPVRGLWHALLLGFERDRSRAPRWRRPLADDLVREHLARARQGLPPALVGEYDWLVLERVLHAAAEYACRRRRPRAPGVVHTASPVERQFPALALTVEVLVQLRVKRVPDSIRRQCRRRIVKAMDACTHFRPSIASQSELAAESERLLALAGASDGRIGKLSREPEYLDRARRSLQSRQARLEQAAARHTPEARRQRLGALLVETSLSSETDDGDAEPVLRQFQRRAVLTRLLAMCAHVQAHHERRVLWQGVRDLARLDDVPALRALLDDPRVVVRTRIRFKQRQAFDEPMLYFPVRDAVLRALDALGLKARTTLTVPLDSDAGQAHVEMLFQRVPRAFRQLRPALQALDLPRYRTLVLPRP